MNRVHDYQALEDQYVHGSMSLRELCRLNDIKHHSPVVTRARADHWDEKRAAFQGKVDARVDDKVAAVQAARRARAMEVTDHAFDAVDKVLTRMVEDLNATTYVRRHDSAGAEIWVEEPIVRVTPAAAAQLIDRLNALVGRPGSIEEHRGTLDLNLSGLPPNILAALAEVAGRRAEPRTVGSSPIPLLEGPVKAN
jgi:hypothetical protein